ncbi:MAG: hypothetical protein KDB98_04110, partial [Flavobacteriales bacterium]|nr:hypothetical protein [Flavobacteriales bacterium]
MKPFITILIILLSFSAFATNDVHGVKDEHEVRLISDNKRTPDAQYQHYLRNQPNWQNFLTQHGTWYVHFNEANGKPHKAFGKPIVVPGSDAIAKADYFVEEMLNGFNIPSTNLLFVNSTRNNHAQHVFYKQQVNGRDVLNSRLSVRLTTTGEVVGFSADVYSNLSVENPSMSASEASAAAIAGLDVEILNVDAQSDWKVLALPKYRTKEMNFRPVYEVLVYTKNEDNIPAN